MSILLRIANTLFPPGVPAISPAASSSSSVDALPDSIIARNYARKYRRSQTLNTFFLSPSLRNNDPAVFGCCGGPWTRCMHAISSRHSKHRHFPPAFVRCFLTCVLLHWHDKAPSHHVQGSPKYFFSRRWWGCCFINNIGWAQFARPRRNCRRCTCYFWSPTGPHPQRSQGW